MADISAKNITPAPGYVLVEPTKAQKQTASGIILPDSHDEKPQSGKVLAVGAAATDHGHKVEAPVKVGDVVIYKKWGGNEFKIGETEYQFFKFEDVLATIK
jgi:chaperonin GroES